MVTLRLYSQWGLKNIGLFKKRFTGFFYAKTGATTDGSSVAIQQSSAEDVLAAGMLVADVLVLVGDCTPYKCCIICSLTIKKFAHTKAENTEK
jgi:hypothetical protein